MPANSERLRELMRGAMVRNTRAVVALKLPRRHATTIRVDGSEHERTAYQELAEAARRLAREGVNRLVLQVVWRKYTSARILGTESHRHLRLNNPAKLALHALADHADHAMPANALQTAAANPSLRPQIP